MPTARKVFVSEITKNKCFSIGDVNNCNVSRLGVFGEDSANNYSHRSLEEQHNVPDQVSSSFAENEVPVCIQSCANSHNFDYHDPPTRRRYQGSASGDNNIFSVAPAPVQLPPRQQVLDERPPQVNTRHTDADVYPYRQQPQHPPPRNSFNVDENRFFQRLSGGYHLDRWNQMQRDPMNNHANVGSSCIPRQYFQAPTAVPPVVPSNAIDTMDFQPRNAVDPRMMSHCWLPQGQVKTIGTRTPHQIQPVMMRSDVYNAIPATLFTQQSVIIPAGCMVGGNMSSSLAGNKMGQKETELDRIKKPTRPLTAYNLYFSEEHEIILAEVKLALSKKSETNGIDGAATNAAIIPDPKEIEEILKSPDLGLPKDELKEMKEKLDLRTRQILLDRLEGKAGKKPPHRRTHGYGVRPLSRAIGDRWKNLDRERKDHYIKLSEMDVVRFKREMDEYHEKKQTLASTCTPTNFCKNPFVRDGDKSGKPRPPLNAYIFFFSEERAVILAEESLARSKKRKLEEIAEDKTLPLLEGNEDYFPDPEEIEMFITRSHDKEGSTSRAEKEVLDTDDQPIDKERAARRSVTRPLAKAIANRWMKLGNGKKEYYKRLAKIDLERFNKAMSAYIKKLENSIDKDRILEIKEGNVR